MQRDISEMTAVTSTKIRLGAIGDLLLATRPGAHTPGRGLEALSSKVRQFYASCDIALANLECTLPGEERVPYEPRVFTSETQVVGLAKAGINIVSLANNHAFDGGEEGFGKLTNLLDRQNIAWFGAGLTLCDAIRPYIMDTKGIRVAFIGAVDASSGMYRFAGPASSGVPPLDHESICRQIRSLIKDVDHIIISPHWGEERFRFPSPEQIKQAHAFIDAGASMVVGHHPHVVQGMEFYREHPIIYSLGNFIANHIYWDNGDYLAWNRFERTGCILSAELNKNTVKNVQLIPVFDNDDTIAFDTTAKGEGYLHTANKMLVQKITPWRYRRENFRVRILLPVLSQLRWKKLCCIRPTHIGKALKLLLRVGK